MNEHGMPLTLELADKGRSGLASVNQHLTNEKARIERQLAIVVDATRAVIKFNADTVDGLPEHIRADLVDRWRRNT